MSERLQFEPPSIFTQRAAEVSYDDGSVSFFGNLSGMFLSVAQDAHKAQLQADVARAKEEGMIAGSSQGVNFRPGRRGGIVQRTYNDAGIQAATVNMATRSNDAISRISLENPGNPGAQAKAMKAWSDKFAENLPNEMLAPFRQSFEKLAGAQITRANSELAKIRQSEAQAGFNDFEVSTFNALEMEATNMMEAGALGVDAAAAVETRRKNYLEMLVQNGPAVGYSVGGYDVKPGSGRSGAFSVEEIGKKMQDFDKKVLGSAVKGDFLRDLEAGNGVASYLNFVKGNTAFTTVEQDGSINQTSVDDMLDIDDKEKISTFMRTHIKTLNTLAEQNDRKMDRARDNYNDAVMDNALATAFEVEEQSDGTKIVRGNPDALRNLYLNAVNDDTGLMRLETVEALQELMETVGSGDVADPFIISKTQLSVINRDIAAVPQLPTSGLGDEKRGEMVKLIRQINNSQHWSNSQRYGSAINLGKAALAPEAATGFALFSDPAKQSAADFAEFQETLIGRLLEAERSGVLPVDINAIPQEGEFDIDKEARSIIDEIQRRKQEAEKDPEIDAINQRIKELNGVINDGSDTEAEKARDELKKIMDQKAKLQMNRLFRQE